MATFKSIAQHAPVYARYQQTAAAGTAPDGYIFVNPTGSNEYFEVAEVRYIYDVAAGAGATADVKVCASGTAPGSGTSALSAAFALDATARVPRKATLASSLASRTIKPGDSIAVDTAGTLTGLAGLVVEVVLKPVKVAKVH